MHEDFKFESTIRFPEKTLVFQNEEDRDKIDKLILQAVDDIIFSGVPGLTSQTMRTWDYNAKFNSLGVKIVKNEDYE